MTEQYEKIDHSKGPYQSVCLSYRMLSIRQCTTPDTWESPVNGTEDDFHSHDAHTERCCRAGSLLNKPSVSVQILNATCANPFQLTLTDFGVIQASCHEPVLFPECPSQRGVTTETAASTGNNKNTKCCSMSS